MLDSPIVLVVLVGLLVHSVLHMVNNVSVIMGPLLPILVVAGLRSPGVGVLRQGILVIPQDLAIVPVPRLECLLILFLGSVVLALWRIHPRIEEIASQERHGVHIASGEVKAIVAAGVHVGVVVASVEVVVATSPEPYPVRQAIEEETG